MKLTTLLMAMITHTVMANSHLSIAPQSGAFSGFILYNYDNADNEKLVEKIVDDIIAMKLASDRETLSFTLSENKMEINNKKQSEEVFKKFKSKYRIEKGLAIAYARSDKSTALSITQP